jgi:hypothetical protein
LVQDQCVSAVRCAVCERPFGVGEQFALQASYVVHRHCVGGVPRPEVHLNDVRRRVSALDSAILRERDQAERLLAEVKEELRRARLERTVSQSELIPLRDSRDSWQSIAESRGGVILALQSEVTLLRNRAAVPVASQTSPPPAAGAPEQISHPEEDLPADDTATRFALLEFD